MAEKEQFEWTRRCGNDAIKTLLVKEPPLFFLPRDQHHTFRPNEDAITNTLVPILERSILSKMDKYTLKVKNNGNGMHDDGYKWRKYGQKSIKNSPNPRSYYKCTNSICNAKKQVERSIDEPNTYIITYDGFHFHFTYPFFIPDKSHCPNKKPKRLKHDAIYKPNLEIDQKSQTHEESKKQAQLVELGHEAQNNTIANESLIQVDQWQSRQGLLEDVVAPAMKSIPDSDGLLEASWSSLSTYTSSSSSSSYETSSPPLSPSYFCWSPNFSFGFSDEILDFIGSSNF